MLRFIALRGIWTNENGKHLQRRENGIYGSKPCSKVLITIGKQTTIHVK